MNELDKQPTGACYAERQRSRRLMWKSHTKSAVLLYHFMNARFGLEDLR